MSVRVELEAILGAAATSSAAASRVYLQVRRPAFSAPTVTACWAQVPLALSQGQELATLIGRLRGDKDAQEKAVDQIVSRMAARPS